MPPLLNELISPVENAPTIPVRRDPPRPAKILAALDPPPPPPPDDVPPLVLLEIERAVASTVSELLRLLIVGLGADRGEEDGGPPPPPGSRAVALAEEVKEGAVVDVVVAAAATSLAILENEFCFTRWELPLLPSTGEVNDRDGGGAPPAGRGTFFLGPPLCICWSGLACALCGWLQR